MKKLCILFAGMLLLGCQAALAQRESTRVNENYTYTSTAARNLEATHEMLVTPLLADVQIQTGGRQVFNKDYFVDVNSSDTWKSQMIDQLKRQALFDFTNEKNADVIVGALISAQTVDRNSDGQSDRDGDRYKIKITITGYPANYVNFRNAKESDLWVKVQHNQADNAQNAAVTDSRSGTVSKGQKTVVVN